MLMTKRERKREYFVYIKMINMVQVDSRSARQQGHILISVLIISDLYRATVACFLPSVSLPIHLGICSLFATGKCQ